MFLFGCCCTEDDDGPEIIEGGPKSKGSKTGATDVFKETAEDLHVVAASPKAMPPEASETQEQAARLKPISMRFEQEDEGECLVFAPPPPDGSVDLVFGEGDTQPEPELGYDAAEGEEEPQCSQCGNTFVAGEERSCRNCGAPRPEAECGSSNTVMYQPPEVNEDEEELPPINPVEAWASSPLGAGFKRNTMEDLRRGFEEEDEPDDPQEQRRGKVDLRKLSVFSAVLTKTGKIGLNVRHHNATMLEVLTIKDGLIKDYNERVCSGVIQGTEVESGDVIDRVNGKRGSASALLKTIAESGKTPGQVRLELGFIRGLPPRQPPPTNTLA